MDITVLCFFHILFINSVFIVIDYFILKNISKTTVYFLPIAVAGLISLFLGIYLTNYIIEYYYHDQWFGFSNGVVKKSFFMAGAVVLTLCNIIIELPFFALATKNRKIGPALKSSVISNLATNIPVGLIYLWGNMFYSHSE